MKPRAFGALTGGKTLPYTWIKITGNLLSCAGDRRLTRPGAEMVVRFNPKNIAFAGTAQGSFDVPDAIYRICSHPRKRHIGCQRTLYHIDSQAWLGSEGCSLRNVSCCKPCRIASPALGQVGVGTRTARNRTL
jgi:hypothetical protein